MLKKVRLKSEPYVIIRLQVLIQRKVTESSGLGNAWDVADKLDSDLEDNTIAKTVCIPSHLSRFGTQFLVGKTG